MRHHIATTAVALLFAGSTWAQVDVNQASEIELDGMKGLGPATTQRILAERQKAPFRDWPDVMRRVPGIGPQKASSLSAQGLRVQGQDYQAQAPETRARQP
jgi:competence protein ComEA